MRKLLLLLLLSGCTVWEECEFTLDDGTKTKDQNCTDTFSQYSHLNCINSVHIKYKSAICKDTER